MPRIQKVIEGRDSLKKTGDMLDRLGIRRPLIVGGKQLTGRLLRRNPKLLSCPVFSGYHPNPELMDAEAGAALYRKEGCDGMLSIGGGSAMDTAKAIKAMVCAEHPEDVIQGTLPETMLLPHLAIPGTAGSGAEATQFAVLYVEGHKRSLSHPDLLPEGVILDAALLESLPVYHQKSCALDALCQGIESSWSRASTEDSQVHAFLATMGVLDNLKSYLAGDPHAAEEMLDASYQSGKAIQITRTTAAHAMSYQLTQTFGIAHGHACMLTLPHLWEQMMTMKEMEELLREISGRMRLGDPMMVPRLLKGMLYALDMEIPTLPSEEVLDALCASVDPERLSNHPVPLSQEDIRRIYRAALTRPSPMEEQMCRDLWNYYGRNA